MLHAKGQARQVTYIIFGILYHLFYSVLFPLGLFGNQNKYLIWNVYSSSYKQVQIADSISMRILAG